MVLAMTLPIPPAPPVVTAGRQTTQPSADEDSFLIGRQGRAAFLDQLNRLLDKCPGVVTIILIGLRSFHAINASLGQEAGDQILAQVALRLRENFPQDTLIARLGGDEFALVFEGLEREIEVLHLTDQIQSLLELPFFTGEKRLFLSGRLGVARGALGDPAEGLMRNASTALRNARQRNRSMVLFQPHHHRSAVDRFDVENGVREALDRDQLRLRYQPIVELPSRRVRGFEALVRWRHPERGLIQPDHFMPAIADSRLASRVDRWVLDEALRQLTQWRSEGLEFPDLTLSINLSGRRLAESDLPERLTQDLNALNIDPAAIKIEITEEKLPEQREAIHSTLRRLGDLGIGLHLDDFGTGYAYLTRLHRVSSEALKIDRSFISRMLNDSISREIVRGLIELAQRLGLQSIAEGVETEEQLELLVHFGCSHAQGYLFSRPIAAEAIPIWLAKQSA